MSDSPYILDATIENFQTTVLDNSFKQPVLVDFWADWCQPCQALMPVLAKLADEYAGAFILAKVNSDEQGDLAAQAGVRSLPTVKLFIDGQIVNEFMGALPEGQVREFLAAYLSNAADAVLQEAAQAFQQGRQQDALNMLNQALAEDPQNAKLKINIAKMVADSGDFDSAVALIDTLSDEDKDQAEVRELLAQIKLAGQLEEIGDPAELQQRIDQDPQDLDARLNMANYLTASSQYEAAMQMLLDVMMKDRSYNDGAARQGLIDLFDMLGNDNPLVKTYRRRMFTLLH